MNGFTSQQTGIQPFNFPPCPGCGSGAYTGQAGMQGQGGFTTMPMVPPRQDLLSQMPTGIPQGPAMGTAPIMQQDVRQQTAVPSQDLTPIVPWNQPVPVTTESLMYMNGFMRTQIGRRVTVEFLIGTNTLVDKTGTLLAVGANYILINEYESDDILLCDFYSIKFMKFYY